MQRVVSVGLDERSASFVTKVVDDGSFASISEVVKAGLALLMHEEREREALIAALIEGEQSGEPEPFDIEEIITEAKSTLRCAA